MSDIEKIYVEDSTSALIMADREPLVKFIRSAVGTGKSVGSLMECAEFCLSVVPQAEDGTPGKARVLVVRQDQTKLKATTLSTFRMWFGEVTDDLTAMTYPIVVKDVPFIGEVDGEERTVLIEWVFMGVASKDEIAKLKSFEATCAFINEVQFYDGDWIVTEVFQRLGRYPMAVRDDEGQTTEAGYQGQRMIICDFNPPDDQHWLYQLEKVGPCPKEWRFYSYPAPLIAIKDAEGTIVDFKPNPAADFARKQPKGYDYWLDDARVLLAKPGMLGKLMVEIFGEYGSSSDGMAVYPTWADEYHLTKSPIATVPYKKLYIGFDSSGSIHPAMTFVQIGEGSRFVVTEEIYAGEYLMEELIHDIFIPRLAAIGIARKDIEIILDPADARDRSGNTARSILMRLGFRVKYAPHQEPAKRIELVAGLLNRRMVVISAITCPVLLAGFRGKYNREKLRGGSGYKALPNPEKLHGYSDTHDSLQYVLGYLIYGAGKEKVAGTSAAPPMHQRHALV